MTTRRNFLKQDLFRPARPVGWRIYSAVVRPTAKSLAIASKVTGDYANKRPAPEARKLPQGGGRSN